MKQFTREHVAALEDMKNEQPDKRLLFHAGNRLKEAMTTLFEAGYRYGIATTWSMATNTYGSQITPAEHVYLEISVKNKRLYSACGTEHMLSSLRGAHYEIVEIDDLTSGKLSFEDIEQFLTAKEGG